MHIDSSQPSFKFPSLGESDKKLLSTGAQHRITLMAASSRNGGPRPHPPDVCTQQPSSASSKAWWLIISKQGTFFCGPLSKEHIVTAAGNAESAERSRFACKGPIATQHPLPLFLIPGNHPDLFPGGLGHPASQHPPKTSSQPHAQHRFRMNKGNFCLPFCFLFLRRKASCYITGLLFC